MLSRPMRSFGHDLLRHAQLNFLGGTYGMDEPPARVLLASHSARSVGHSSLPLFPSRSALLGGAKATDKRELSSTLPNTTTWEVSVCAPHWEDSGRKGSKNTRLKQHPKSDPSQAAPKHSKKHGGHMSVMRVELITFTDAEIKAAGITDDMWLDEAGLERVRDILFKRNTRLMQKLLDAFETITASGNPVVRGDTNVWAELHFQLQQPRAGSGAPKGLADRRVRGATLGAASRYAPTPLADVCAVDTTAAAMEVDERAVGVDSGRCLVDVINLALAHVARRLKHAARPSNTTGDVTHAGIVASLQAYRYECAYGPIQLWRALDGTEGVYAAAIDTPADLFKLRIARCLHASEHGHMVQGYSGIKQVGGVYTPPFVASYNATAPFPATPREALEAVFKPARAGVDFIDQANGELVLGYRADTSDIDSVVRILIGPGHVTLATGCIETLMHTVAHAANRDAIEEPATVVVRGTLTAARHRKEVHAKMGAPSVRATRSDARAAQAEQAATGAAIELARCLTTPVVTADAPPPLPPSRLTVSASVTAPRAQDAQWVDSASDLGHVHWGSGGAKDPPVLRLVGDFDVSEQADRLRARGIAVTEYTNGAHTVDEARFFTTLSMPLAVASENEAYAQRKAAAEALTDTYRRTTALASAERAHATAMNRLKSIAAKAAAARVAPADDAIARPPPAAELLLVRCVSLRCVGAEAERKPPVTKATLGAYTKHYNALTSAMMAHKSTYAGTHPWSGDFDAPAEATGMLWHMHNAYIRPLCERNPTSSAPADDGVYVIHDLTMAYTALLRQLCATHKFAPVFTEFDRMLPFTDSEELNERILDAILTLTPIARKARFKRASRLIDSHSFYEVEAQGELPVPFDLDGGWILFRSSPQTVPGWFLNEMIRHPQWAAGWRVTSVCTPSELQPLAPVMAAIDAVLRDSTIDRALKKWLINCAIGLLGRRFNTHSAPVLPLESPAAAAAAETVAWEAETEARNDLARAVDEVVLPNPGVEDELLEAARVCATARHREAASAACAAHPSTSIAVRRLDDGQLFLQRSVTRELEQGHKPLQHWVYAAMASSLFKQYCAIQRSAMPHRIAGTGDMRVLGARTDCWQVFESGTAVGAFPRRAKADASLGQYAVMETSLEDAHVPTRMPRLVDLRAPNVAPSPQIDENVWAKEMPLGDKVRALVMLLYKHGVVAISAEFAGAGKTRLAEATCARLCELFKCPAADVVVALPTHALAGYHKLKEHEFTVVTHHKLVGINPFANEARVRPLGLSDKVALIVDECGVMDMAMRSKLRALQARWPHLLILVVGDAQHQIGPILTMRHQGAARAAYLQSSWDQFVPARVTLQGSWRLGDSDTAMLSYLKTHVLGTSDRITPELLVALREDPVKRSLEARAREACIMTTGSLDGFEPTFTDNVVAFAEDEISASPQLIWRTRPWLVGIDAYAAVPADAHFITFLRATAQSLAMELRVARGATTVAVIGETWKAWLRHRKAYGGTWVYTQQRFVVREVTEAHVEMEYACDADVRIQVPLSDFGKLWFPATADNINAVQGSEFSVPLVLADVEHYHLTPKHLYTMLTRTTSLAHLYEWRAPHEQLGREAEDAILAKRCAGYAEQDRRAKRAIPNEPFVDAAFFRTMWDAQRGGCLTCGTQTILAVSDARYAKAHGVIGDLATLDRVDNARAHVCSNIGGVVCNSCNSARAQRAFTGGATIVEEETSEDAGSDEGDDDVDDATMHED